MEINGFVCYEDGNEINEKVLHYYEGKSKEVVIPSQFEVIEMGCFQGNSQIESLEIPESVNLIKSQAFAECPNLKSVKIPGNLYGISADSFGDTSATVKILKSNPNYIEKDGFIINKANNTILFVLDNSKESYSIPEGVEYIGFTCFLGCENLKKITIPESVRCIEMMGFFGCKNLEKVDFPKGLKYIGGAAFALCENLKEFSLPEGVDVVGIGNEIIVQ